MTQDLLTVEKDTDLYLKTQKAFDDKARGLNGKFIYDTNNKKTIEILHDYFFNIENKLDIKKGVTFGNPFLFIRVLLNKCIQRGLLHSALLKALPIILTQTRPITEAISSAGGVAWSTLTTDLQIKNKPNVFCAGEMIDWEAPTGGYLLTACFATAKCAALGVVSYLGLR